MPKPQPKRLALPHNEPPVRLAPLSGPRAPFARDESSGGATSNALLPRILIVEDDFLVSGDMEAELIDAGYVVVGVATSAKEAIELATAEEPHLVIMDIRLEGPSDGVEAAIEIFKSKGIRSLFASAYYDAETRRRAEPCAPLGWIGKPYPMGALVAAVRHAMRAIGGPEPQAK
jgi:two-component system, response regulator PdtaR